MVSSLHMTLLIDYSSLLYRAFHSLPDTIPMRGVYGFFGMLAPCSPTVGPRASPSPSTTTGGRRFG